MTVNRLSGLVAFQIGIVMVLASGVAVRSPADAAHAHSGAAATPRFKAIAFDYLVLFNPDSVVPEVERVFPGKGRDVTNLWRDRGIFLQGTGYIRIDVRKPLSGAAEMNRVIVGACVAFALTAAVGAQDKKMSMEKMDHMVKEKAYSGCLESSHTGSYTLTHSMAADAKNSMKTADSMKKDDPMMKTDSMKKDEAMAHDAMAPESLALSPAAGVNLRKHVGHKVTVTGTDGDNMNGMTTFNVKTIKMIAGSCS